MRDRAHRRHVVILQRRGPARKSSASRSWCRRRHWGGSGALCAGPRRHPLWCRRRAHRKHRSARPTSLTVRHCADCVEIIERESKRVQNFVAARARRILAMLLPCARAPRAVCRRSVFSFRAGTLAGGGLGGVPSTFSSSHLPRCTGDVRVAMEVTVRMLPCPSRPRRGRRPVTRCAGTGCRRRSGFRSAGPGAH